MIKTAPAFTVRYRIARILALLLAVVILASQSNLTGAVAAPRLEDKYVCPPCRCGSDHIIHDMPGLCSACGMKLVVGNSPAAANLSSARPPLTTATGGAVQNGIVYTPYTFEAYSGEKVAAEIGVFEVPENRAKAGSRRIKLHFVRFASTNPKKGAPIVYLAGGPGDSGVDAARGARFPLFMALRAVGDVIAFDQRGTGWSNDIPPFDIFLEALPSDQVVTREMAVEFMRKSALDAVAFWPAKGVDLSGYNTQESAADIEMLRSLLGADKISLWGISYGSHLALAVLKRYPKSVERMALAAIEGLDETVKLPALTDAYFARVQSAIDADPAAAKTYPDLVGMMRRVHATLDRKPATVSVRDADGKEVTITFGKFELQVVVAGSISDPQQITRLPALYAAMDAGNFNHAGALVYRVLRSSKVFRLSGMPQSMDSASGISRDRADLVAQQAQTSLLGDTLNFPMPHIAGALGVPDLGEEFRSAVQSDVATLFLSGTLDGRTYPESAAQIAKRFSQAAHVVVENGGHNLFEAAPAIGQLIVSFLKGDAISNTRLQLPPPQFAVR